jgi:hypothetical protein
MAYTINKTDTTVVTTIADGTVDNTTSLQLFGKSYSGFGEGLNENLVKLLENSASTSAPSAPLRGELWFDTNTNQIKVYDGTSFKPTGGSKSSSTQPTSSSAGDLWHDSTNDQIYVYTGTAWQLVGPVYTKGQTLSGWQIETLDSAGGNKVVSSMYVGNTRVAILSKETFTPTVVQSGFADIKAGLTLNSTLSAVFEGTNTQARFIDVSTTSNTSSTLIAGGNFLRADAANTTIGALTVDADGGVIIGDAQELSITVSSNDVTIAQTSQDKDLKFTVNDGGVTKTPLQLTGADGGVDITGDVTITGNLTISGSYDKSSVDVSTYVDAFIGVNEGNGTDVNGGLIVERGSTGNEARVQWNETSDKWEAGITGSYSTIIREADAISDGDANKNSGFLRTTAAGLVTVTNINLAAVGSAITTSDTASVSVPTIGQVATFGEQWGGSKKFVATAAPNGINDAGSADGDFFFVREN